ncbi:MAG: hypothetical protein AB1805_13680 [Nitrospirota bacterium]
MSKSEIEEFIGAVDSVLSCRGKACLLDAVREYAEKNGYPSDERGSYQLKEIYENHKALHRQ